MSARTVCLDIQAEDRPGSSDLGSLVDTTVWVDLVHPAYRLEETSRFTCYRLAWAVAIAWILLAIGPAFQHRFLRSFGSLG